MKVLLLSSTVSRILIASKLLKYPYADDEVINIASSSLASDVKPQTLKGHLKDLIEVPGTLTEYKLLLKCKLYLYVHVGKNYSDIWR